MKWLVLTITCSCFSCSSFVYDHKTDRANQIKIASAYLAYGKSCNRYPTSIGEMVNRGLLPEEGEFYKNGINIGGGVVHYSAADYTISPPTLDHLKSKRIIRYVPGNRAGINFENLQDANDIFPREIPLRPYRMNK